MKLKGVPTIKSLPLILSILPAGLLIAGIIQSRIQSSSAVITILFLLFFLFSAGMILAYVLSCRNAGKRESSFLNELKDDSLDRLNNAISEFARGNIAVTVDKNERYNDRDPQQYRNGIIDKINDIIDDFNTITSIPLKRLCYVGADSYLEGYTCGLIMGKLIGSKGEILIMVGQLNNIGHYLRRKGFMSALSSNYPGLSISDTIEEFEEDEKTYSLASSYLKKNRNIKGLYVSEGSTPSSAARAVEEISPSIQIVTHDITEATARYIRKGIIKASLSQNPFAQGYNSVIMAYNFLASGEIPQISRMLTDMEEVNSSNLDSHWDSTMGQILSEKSKRNLQKPAEGVLQGRKKIAVLIPGKEQFWEPVYKGALDASMKLSENGCTVDVILPGEKERCEFSAECLQTIISEKIRGKYDALCLPVYEQELTVILNELSREGMPIITYNAEPFYLRAILGTVIDATRKLFAFSENMASSSIASSTATGKISETMSTIDTHTKNQLQKLAQTLENLDVVLENVEGATVKTGECMDTGENTVRIATQGSKAVMGSNAAIEEAQSVMHQASDITANLNDRVKEIREITTIISDMASRTNTISINASILSARAGEQGKGFSVVANEIRSLAEQSMSRSEDISHIVDGLFQSMNEAVEMINKAMETVNSSTELSRQAGAVLEEIIDATGLNQEKIANIRDIIMEIKGFSENLQVSMKELESVNNENSRAIEEVSQGANDISRQVSQDSHAAQQLTEMAQSQNDVLAQYFDHDK